jgi:antitoxin component YwqK of YwqJK toxin-antitoxin module
LPTDLAGKELPVEEDQKGEDREDDVHVTYYANGNKMSEGRYVNGKKEGLWILYWPNGNKKSEATFSEGKYTGLYTSYHENGKRRYQGRYNEIKGVSADGTKAGVWHVYEEDGETIHHKITYRRGSRAKPDEYPPFEPEG